MCQLSNTPLPDGWLQIPSRREAKRAATRLQRALGEAGLPRVAELVSVESSWIKHSTVELVPLRVDEAKRLADALGPPSHRVDEPLLDVRLPARPEAAHCARRLTRLTLTAFGAAARADDAELVVSELVTNAVRYGRGSSAIALCLGCQGPVLHVSVTDGNPVPPRERAAQACDVAGRGLVVVDALANDWGVEPTGRGKTVWALLSSV